MHTYQKIRKANSSPPPCSDSLWGMGVLASFFFFFAYVNFLLLCNEYESTKQQTKRKDFLKEVSRWRSTQADCEYAIAGVGVMLP